MRSERVDGMKSKPSLPFVLTLATRALLGVRSEKQIGLLAVSLAWYGQLLVIIACVEILPADPQLVRVIQFS